MLRVLRDLAVPLVVAVALFFFIDNVTSRNYVDQTSMEPTLHKDQVLLVSRLGISGFTGTVYAATRDNEGAEAGTWVPPRGTICTFKHPSEDRILVKRLIGLPGEEISIDRGRVYINGQPLDEPYVVFHDQRSVSATKIPQDSVYMLGDNRPASGDSRMFGAVPRANLLGIAVLRYWPPDAFGLLVGGS